MDTNSRNKRSTKPVYATKTAVTSRLASSKGAFEAKVAPIKKTVRGAEDKENVGSRGVGPSGRGPCQLKRERMTTLKNAMSMPVSPEILLEKSMLEQRVELLTKQLTELTTRLSVNKARNALQVRRLEQELKAERLAHEKTCADGRKAKATEAHRADKYAKAARDARTLLKSAQAIAGEFKQELDQTKQQLRDGKQPATTTRRQPARQRTVWECPVCFEPRSDERRPSVTPCGHVFCMPCLVNVGNKCPLCNKMFEQEQVTAIFLDTL